MLYHYERATQEFKEHWALWRRHRKLQGDAAEEEGINEMTSKNGVRLLWDIHDESS